MLCHRARREGKALANFTQKAIRASFIKLLNQKPLSQITIKDIVDDCGVNRNTFYYYLRPAGFGGNHHQGGSAAGDSAVSGD